MRESKETERRYMAFILVYSFCFRSDMCYHLSGNETYPTDITNTAGADDTDKIICYSGFCQNHFCVSV